MAHRGKYWPVHFRRDFNWNCDIRSLTAFPRDWTIIFNSHTSPGYLIDGERFILTEIEGPNPSTIAWLSASRTIGIWDWQVRLFVRFINLPDSVLQSEWILYRDVIIVARWRRIFSDRFDPVTGGNPLTYQTLFVDVTTFPVGADFNYSTMHPTGYIT